jgi:hypothetical protein
MAFDPITYELCCCGCTRDEHDEVTGLCRYCTTEDCGGFTYDETATVIALASIGEEL